MNILGPDPARGAVAVRPAKTTAPIAAPYWYNRCTDPTDPAQTKITADFLNDIAGALREFIASVGATQSESQADSDLMLAESAARYASLGIYGTCSGAANAYAIAKSSNVVVPKTLFTGMRLRTKPSATNTGPSTANAFTLGSKKILTWEGAALKGGELIAARDTEWEYDATLDSGSGAWRIVPWALIAPGALINPTGQITKINSLGNATGASIATATYTTIGSGYSVTYNEIGGAATSGSITIPVDAADAVYQISAYGAFTGGAIVRPYMSIKLNGGSMASTIGADGTSQPLNLSATRKLSAGDVITLECWHNSGANRTFENIRIDMMRFG